MLSHWKTASNIRTHRYYRKSVRSCWYMIQSKASISFLSAKYRHPIANLHLSIFHNNVYCTKNLFSETFSKLPITLDIPRSIVPYSFKQLEQLKPKLNYLFEFYVYSNLNCNEFIIYLNTTKFGLIRFMFELV